MNPISPELIIREHPQAERFFAQDVQLFKERLAELDSEIDPNSVPCRNDAYHQRVLQAFQDSQDACRRFEAENQDNPDLVLDAQEGFRNRTDHWFSRSWIAHRARTKPSGFAGDYEMLVKLYEEATPARGLGGYLDLCILELPLARVVRARLAAAREFVVRETAERNAVVRILDIACGPCWEYRDWPTHPNGNKTEIIAMDSDPNALTYIETHVVPQVNGVGCMQAVRYNALRTRSSSATIRKFGGKFDIIYSVGLCDYLSDEHLIRMLSGWRDTLRDNGVLYVAFKDCERYDKTPYQWHLDWFFFQRTVSDVFRLYREAGFDTERMTTTRDATGIIVNCMDRRTQRRRTRIDSPEGLAGPVSEPHVSDPNISDRKR